jgi:hypothetical protein
MRERARRPMGTAGCQCCELGEHRSPHFRWAAEPVSAKESYRSVAIAHPNAAVGAAVGIDVSWYRGPGQNHQAGLTKGGTAHLLVVSGCTCLPLFCGATIGPYASRLRESSLLSLSSRGDTIPAKCCV